MLEWQIWATDKMTPWWIAEVCWIIPSHLFKKKRDPKAWTRWSHCVFVTLDGRCVWSEIRDFLNKNPHQWISVHFLSYQRRAEYIRCWTSTQASTSNIQSKIILATSYFLLFQFVMTIGLQMVIITANRAKQLDAQWGICSAFMIFLLLGIIPMTPANVCMSYSVNYQYGMQWKRDLHRTVCDLSSRHNFTIKMSLKEWSPIGKLPGP